MTPGGGGRDAQGLGQLGERDGRGVDAERLVQFAQEECEDGAGGAVEARAESERQAAEALLVSHQGARRAEVAAVGVAEAVDDEEVSGEPRRARVAVALLGPDGLVGLLHRGDADGGGEEAVGRLQKPAAPVALLALGPEPEHDGGASPGQEASHLLVDVHGGAPGGQDPGDAARLAVLPEAQAVRQGLAGLAPGRLGFEQRGPVLQLVRGADVDAAQRGDVGHQLHLPEVIQGRALLARQGAQQRRDAGNQAVAEAALVAAHARQAWPWLPAPECVHPEHELPDAVLRILGARGAAAPGLVERQAAGTDDGAHQGLDVRLAQGGGAAAHAPGSESLDEDAQQRSLRRLGLEGAKHAEPGQPADVVVVQGLTRGCREPVTEHRLAEHDLDEASETDGGFQHAIPVFYNLSHVAAIHGYGRPFARRPARSSLRTVHPRRAGVGRYVDEEVALAVWNIHACAGQGSRRREAAHLATWHPRVRGVAVASRYFWPSP